MTRRWQPPPNALQPNHNSRTYPELPLHPVTLLFPLWSHFLLHKSFLLPLRSNLAITRSFVFLWFISPPSIGAFDFRGILYISSLSSGDVERGTSGEAEEEGAKGVQAAAGYEWSWWLGRFSMDGRRGKSVSHQWRLSCRGDREETVYLVVFVNIMAPRHTNLIWFSRSSGQLQA